MSTGANARSGDIVRNIATGRTGVVVGSSQFGRVIVEVKSGARVKWERWAIEVIGIMEKVTRTPPT